MYIIKHEGNIRLVADYHRAYRNCIATVYKV